jgi:hypothetical protein
MFGAFFAEGETWNKIKSKIEIKIRIKFKLHYMNMNWRKKDNPNIDRVCYQGTWTNPVFVFLKEMEIV